MNWLEEAEYNKKKLEGSQKSVEDEKKKNLSIITEKFERQFTKANIIEKRINDVYPSEILGRLNYSETTYTSGGLRITKDICDDSDHRNYLYKKRRLLITTNSSDVNNCAWIFYEDFYEYSSYRDIDWSYSSWSNYETEIKKQLLIKKSIPIDQIGTFQEDFWLKIFEWIMFKTDKIYF